MNLYVATYLFAAILIALGIPFAVSPKKSADSTKKIARNKNAAIVLFGIALVWFIWILFNLGEADFGDIKHILILVFGAAGLLAFSLTPDFLAVRGAAVIALLGCRQFLDAAYMQEPESRLFLVTFAYITVVAAIYFGSIPYRVRDVCNAIIKAPIRGKIFGYLCVVCSITMFIASIFY